MLAIEVELLGGRYVATGHNDRGRAEWPPHPARFFSALVAALHDHDPPDSAERAALVWLEGQPAPQLDVDLDVSEVPGHRGRRNVQSVFVPVNDVTVFGDPEEPLRDARESLERLLSEPESSTVASDVKKARNTVDRLQAKFAETIASLQSVDESPAAANISKARALLPERRVRQQRTFPVVVPGRSTFAFLWPDAMPADHAGSLQRLCERVTRLGHSSSLVRCGLVDRALQPTLVPAADGTHVLRVIGPGQLERLELEYERHKAVEPRVLPARPQRYAEPTANVANLPSSVFGDDWIVFERIGGDRPLGSRGHDLATALRRALIEIHGTADLPAVLGGHTSAGEPAESPHIAFVALPWVDHDHADGSVQALAIVAPRAINSPDRTLLSRLVAKLESTKGDRQDGYAIDLGTSSEDGRQLRVRIGRVEVPTKTTARAGRWCRPSRRFVTATPIALDRHPGELRSNTERTAHRAALEAQMTIADACERIGLQRPTSVSISLAPLLAGAQHVRQFAPWPSTPGRTRRARVHADITFPTEVRGPVLIGAGRYFGLGLCLPVKPRENGANGGSET